MTAALSYSHQLRQPKTSPDITRCLGRDICPSWEPLEKKIIPKSGTQVLPYDSLPGSIFKGPFISRNFRGLSGGLGRIPEPALAYGNSKALTHDVTQEGIPAISFCQLCFQFPLNPVSEESAGVKVKVCESGGEDPSQRADSGVWGCVGTGWQGWPRDHQHGPNSAGRMWPRPAYLCLVILVDHSGGKGNGEQTDLTSGGAQSTHFSDPLSPSVQSNNENHGTIPLVSCSVSEIFPTYSSFSLNCKLQRAGSRAQHLLLHTVQGSGTPSAQHAEGIDHPGKAPFLPCGLGALSGKITCQFPDCLYCLLSQVHLILCSVPPS